jgi:hypothetical protein
MRSARLVFVSFVSLVFLLPLVSFVRAAQLRTRVDPVAPDRLVTLERWLKAVDQQMPGGEDDALVEVGSWKTGELRNLWIDANVLVQVIRNLKRVRFSVQPEEQRAATDVRYTRLRFAAGSRRSHARPQVCSSPNRCASPSMPPTRSTRRAPAPLGSRRRWRAARRRQLHPPTRRPPAR